MNENSLDMAQKPVEELPRLKDGVGLASHLFLWLCVISCALFGYWSWQGTLAVVSVAEGEVVPSSQIKTIQHLEGGIVREIKIREGEKVKQGQPLIVLESTSSGADVTELQTRIVGLKIEMARLEAEATNKAQPDFPEDMAKAYPRLIGEAMRLFTSRRNRLQNEISSQRAIISQRRRSIQEITARIKNQRKSLKLSKEQIAISDELLKEQLSNRYKHLDLLKEAAKLEGAISQDKVAVQRAESALKQAQANFAGVRSRFSEEARISLDAARRQLEEFAPRLEKFQDSLKRTVLRSPVNGVIKTLHVVTIGGVLRAGDAVLDIVPAGDRLVIEARLATQDIGYVRAGQTSIIKLASSDAMRFDNLSGTVASVSPDTITAEDGVPYYKVRIETDRDHFRRGANRYDLLPGMQVITSIHTGERTVMEYLIDPFLNAQTSALRER